MIQFRHFRVPRRIVLYMLAVATVVVVGSVAWMARPHATPDLSSMSLSEAKNYWTGRIRAVDGKAAYSELTSAAEKLAPREKHYEAHIFGDVLFTEKGIGGITVCDGKFLYGCSHAFIMRGIETLGINAVEAFNSACKERFGSDAGECQHGIGHGVLGVQGYSEDALRKALKICDVVDSDTLPYRDCAGGAFMEYNLHWVQDLKGEVRTFTSEADIWKPCNAVDSKYIPACAYWQPEWWTKTALREKPPEERAKIMGSWCDQVSYDTQFRAFCMYGITYLMPGLTGEIPEKSSEICKLLARNQDEQTTCQEGSAIRFIYYMPLEKSLRACNGLSPADASHCRDAATQFTKNRRRDQFMPSGGE